MVKCASVLCFLVVLGAAQQGGAQETAQDIGQRHLREADSQSPEGRALRERLNCERVFTRAVESTEAARRATNQYPAWQLAKRFWDVPPECSGYITPAHRQMMMEVDAALAAQQLRLQQSQCERAKASLEAAVQEAERPEEFRDQTDVDLKENRAEVVRDQLELFLPACPAGEQIALRSRIDEVVARKDAEVKASIAKFMEAERLRQVAAQKARQKKAATQKSLFEGQEMSIRTSGPATLPPTPQATRKRAPSGLRCCDGSLSPSCSCSGSHRGCCSHHGGVCGCQ
jgi:hypothetical protein